MEHGAGWTDELRAELKEGLASLPAALREFPGGPLELELHATEAPFGMGDGSTALPEWTDGRRRFHLYAFAAGADRRATWRLEALTQAQREKLWRRRAMVHAVMQRWEERHHFTRRPAWRSLNGWLHAFERPFTWTESALNLADAAYSRARGKDRAELDLVTFAEEHFVPVESIDPAALPIDDRVACQEFSKRRVLEQLLTEHQLLAAPSPRPACPAFDEWADLDHLEQLEVLLVQASGRAAQSLFGHVLLRPVHSEDGRVRGPSFDSAIQLAALTNPEAGVKHLATGIFGGYRMTVFTVSWRDFEREMLEDEQRSIRRFRLQLTRAEQRQVLERSWELERRGEFQYQFFSDNCAAGLQWLMVAALGEKLEVGGAGRFIVAPGAVVDGLADATLNGRKLLARINDDLESTSQRAERSERLRRTVEARVLATASNTARWTAQFDAARSADPAVRVAAYVAAQELTRVQPMPALYDWWALTVRIERPLSDRADETLRSLRRRTALPAPGGTPYDPGEELMNRQRLFERETQLQRHWMMLDRAESVQKQLAELEHRPLTEGEQEEQDAANAARAAFDQLTAIHGQVVSEQFPGVDALAWLEKDRAQKTGVQAVLDADSVPQSGHWRTTVGAGAWVDRSGAIRPVISLQSSGLAELLGDQRVRGFQASSELRILDTEVVLAPHLAWEWPEVVQSKLTLFAFRSIKRELPMANDGRLARFGWGLSLDTDFRAGRTIPSRTSVGGELIAIGGHDQRFGKFFTGSIGASGFVGWGDGPFAAGVAPHVVLSARAALPGHGANAVRIEARGQLGVAPTRAQLLMPELSVNASLELLLGQPGGLAVLLRPQAWVHAEPGARPVQLVAVLGLELL